MHKPLDGITVVALEQAVAAPFATRQLADLGARVIKVERSSGDFARGYDASVHGQSSYFVWLNRGKESIALDLKQPDDLALLKRIIGTADVFVQNLAPGAVSRLGLGETDLRAENSKLIHVSISGYGPGGPMEHKKAYDLLIQCEAGLLSVTGSPESAAKVGISIADIAAGMYAYTGILTSLINRARTGNGDALEISMLEALGEWMEQPELYARYRDHGQQPRSGAQHATIAPYGPFDTVDGVVFFGIQNEREWLAFCDVVLGKCDVAQDPDFAGNTARVCNRGRLHDAIDAVLADLSTHEVLQRLDAAGIANAQLRDMHGFSQHPQLEARARWADIETPAGVVRALRPPVVSSTYEPMMRAVPSVGEHTESIKREFPEER
ncbi:CaiB/BaiF CoA transferase family protein [Glaciibacter superstes]|uniref:CaiB/BaiF CoA transferase family protein n=1 Tax=Glaciibacter superstes TaxID=501023 RepID=UPI0003B7AC48|nr:CaiB/BaiF CoA-transferase family protein [Glaciibacter superstes]